MADLSLSLSLFPFFISYFLRKRYALRVRFSFAPFPSTATDSTDKRGVSKKENGYIEREWTRGRLIQF